jgi:DNA-binding Xre family transcriptional regulator
VARATAKRAAARRPARARAATARAVKRDRAGGKNPREGSTLDDFLRDEGLHEEATATAVKETIAWQISEVMTRLGVTKTEMAARMRTSRAALDRLLDPANESVTLATLLRACEALGVELSMGLRARR